MARQINGNPIIIEDIEDTSKVNALRRVKFSSKDKNVYNESWIQDLIFKHPDLVPIDEIEPIFSPLIPICRELGTAVGPVDNVYINDEGLLTIVECKLWRNPDARRDVVGQILDYAKEISAWTYEDLSESVRKKTKTKGNILFEIASRADSTLDEAIFVDKVTRNLKKGNFLLLIVGDGIKESVENITNFLQKHAGIHFTFGLVELGVYKFRDSEKKYLVQPRVLTRTVEIERAVIRTEGNLAVIDEPESPVVTHRQAGKKKNITEDMFYEKIKQADPEVASLLPDFFDKCIAMGLTITPKKAMTLHWYSNEGTKINFGSIYSGATIRTSYICYSLQELGDVGIGVRYLESVSNLIADSTVIKEGGSWTWKVTRNKRDPEIKELLFNQDKFLAIIQSVMHEISQLES